MTPDAPEFRTQASTPISPIPLHPPEPSNIPVLQKQTDPIFNMTSTHMNSAPEHPAAVDANPVEYPPAADNDDRSEAGSSLSDLYEEAGDAPNGAAAATAVNKGGDATMADDDYAKAFESDAEDISDSQDVSKPSVDQDSQTAPNPVPDVELSAPTSSSTHDNQTNPELSTAEIATSYEPVEATSALAVSEGQAAQAEDVPAEVADESANGGIDIQQLLDNITATATATVESPAIEQPSNAEPSLSGPASLPPRPPSAANANAQTSVPPSHGFYAPPPAAGHYDPTSTMYPSLSAGAPGTSSESSNGLPPPPLASFQNPASLPPNPLNQEGYRSVDTWGPDLQKLYDEFIEEERAYVTEGLWDRFPVGSRLFIGNLPTEKVSKRDLFKVFHKHGRLAQISLKQAYGFVQFHTTRDCLDALDKEQGTEVGGRAMHLEISKPQKNTKSASRRSRSPEHSAKGRDREYGRNDRFGGRASRESDRSYGYSNDTRSRRSPSPRGKARSKGRGGRDEYGHSRGRQYDERDRRRSRSRSPQYGRRGSHYRDRSPSPRSREALEDADLQIPRRATHEVPDVQIILTDELDRAFVSWVENEIRSRNLRTDVMFLSPRVPFGAVMRRQILEGVVAVSKLDPWSQQTSKIPLTVFDRKRSSSNVGFDEYKDLEPRVAAELVLRAKAESGPPSYAPQYPPQQQYQQPPLIPTALGGGGTPAPALASLLGQLDNATMQKLLGALSGGAQPAQPAPAAGDIAGLLGALAGQAPAPAPPPQMAYQPPPQAQPVQASYDANAALASLLGGAGGLPSGTPHQPQAQAQHQPAQDVQNIMAHLAKYRQ